MKNIQEIFSGRFANASTAVVQKLKPTPRNVTNLMRGYTEHWAPVSPETDLLVVEYLIKGDRKIWVGRFVDQQNSLTEGKTTKLYRLYVDSFDLFGFHNTTAVSDADFYNLPKGGGGGARLLVTSTQSTRGLPGDEDDVTAAPGEMVQRLMWLRKNHRAFRDPVAKHWQYRCAVTGTACNGLLVASHIKPWSMSAPAERTDKHNGLYLAAPFDALFDRGLIGFQPTGQIVIRKDVLVETCRIFGLKRSLTLRHGLITQKMQIYLAWHLSRFGLVSRESDS